MTKKAFFTSYTFYFPLIVIAYSFYDYTEHILRPDTVFNEYPLDWFLFSFASIGSLLLLVLGIKSLLEKYFKTKNLLFELSAIGIWLFLHLNILGPLYDRLLWPHSELFFSFQFSGFFILLAIYFTIRVILNLIMKKPWLKGY